MSLHLLKLCVGAESLEDHRDWIAQTLERKRRAGLSEEQLHTTRMVPKQRDALLNGGSLYWVIKGSIQGRQKLLDIRPFKDEEGISRCHLVMEPILIATRPQPRRPFQGWRYLKASDAPADLSETTGDDLRTIEPAMRRDLIELGLL
ncbi:MAG: DUF1489 domain-containing protein [Hyphomicrobiales bacterium]|jgi:hypothetical protein